MVDNYLSTDIVNIMSSKSTEQRIIDAVHTLDKCDDIGYTLQVHKTKSSPMVFVSVSIQVDVDDDSQKYFDVIYKCHNDIQQLGFNDITLHSTTKYAIIYATMILQ